MTGRIGRLLVAAFVLFELTRVWALRDWWLSLWIEFGEKLVAPHSEPPWVSTLAWFLTITIVGVPIWAVWKIVRIRRG